MKDTKDPSP